LGGLNGWVTTTKKRDKKLERISKGSLPLKKIFRGLNFDLRASFLEGFSPGVVF